LRRSEDYDLWLRAASAGFRIAVNPRPLGVYRRRPDSVSADESLMLQAMCRPLDKLRGSCAYWPDVQRAVDRQIARVQRRALVARARHALMIGDMPELASRFSDLEIATGARRYRVARWLTGSAPVTLRWAYACKRGSAYLTRTGRRLAQMQQRKSLAVACERGRHEVHAETGRGGAEGAAGVAAAGDMGEVMRNSAQSNARVAVVIPVFKAGYLAEALQSVFYQTRQPDEVIVVDDGSPDRELLSCALEAYAGRVTVIRQRNEGVASARNRGIQTTSADFVALLDADDVWMPEFLHEQLALLTAHPEIDVVYSDGLVMGSTGLSGQRFMNSCPSSGLVTLESLLAQQCTVLLSAVVARRRSIADAGGFDLTIRRGQDFDLWLRMAQCGARFTYQRKVLVIRRVHGDNLSGTALNEQERPLRVLEKAVRTMALSPSEREIAERRIRHLRGTLARESGKELLRQGDVAGARREFTVALRTAFSWKLQFVRLGLHIAPNLLCRLYVKRTATASSGLTPIRPLS